jgi:hypothetical protein
VTLLLLLDFFKVFNNVQHSLLLKKLSLYFKFGGTAVVLVGSYLSDRFQGVSVGEILSELIAVTRGVGYCCVLKPLLFSIFINDIDRLLSISYERRRCAALSESFYHLYRCAALSESESLNL